MLVVAPMASPLLFAQITTSAVNGTVKNNADEPLVGATIVATHQPSGTKYSTVSRAGGQFSIQNMRVGGPYFIEVSFVGHEAGKFENVYLQLAESFLLNPALIKTSGSLENVVLTSGRKKWSRPESNSPSSAVLLRWLFLTVGMRRRSGSPSLSICSSNSLVFLVSVL